MQFSFKCNFYNQQIGVVRVNHKTKFGIQLDILRIIIIPLACSIANNILNHNGKIVRYAMNLVAKSQYGTVV